MNRRGFVAGLFGVSAVVGGAQAPFPGVQGKKGGNPETEKTIAEIRERIRQRQADRETKKAERAKRSQELRDLVNRVKQRGGLTPDERARAAERLNDPAMQAWIEEQQKRSDASKENLRKLQEEIQKYLDGKR